MNDANLTAIMEREGIEKIKRYKALGKWCVVLDDGRMGEGRSVGAALAKAKLPDAVNVGKVPAEWLA